MSEPLRLFVGLFPPDDVCAALEHLDREDVSGWRWTTRDQWHVTLAFLGRADPDAVVGLLGQVEHPPVTLELGSQAVLLGNHDVVALPVSGADSLAVAVREATGTAGLPFTGHLTLARRRRGGQGDLSPAIVRRLSWKATSFALVASETLPTGAHYRPVAQFPLSCEISRSRSHLVSMAMMPPGRHTRQDS